MQPNEAMKAMARRVASRFAETSENIDYEIHIALAAIMETQSRLMSALEDERVEIDAAKPYEIDVECNALVERCLDAIRTGEHYALAGDRHD